MTHPREEQCSLAKGAQSKIPHQLKQQQIGKETPLPRLNTQLDEEKDKQKYLEGLHGNKIHVDEYQLSRKKLNKASS